MDEVMEKVGYPVKKFKTNCFLLGVSTKEDIEKVVSSIQETTKVTWSVRCTRKFYSEKSRTSFKRIYSCHLSTRRRKTTQKLKQKKSRNLDCPAQLFVTVKKFFEHSKSKKPAQDKYPCVMEFRNEHNHEIDDENALRQRPVGGDVKQDIIALLKKGHSVASAYHTYYTIKVEEFGDEHASKMRDRHFFPTKNDVGTIWKMNDMKNKFDECFASFANTLTNLESILRGYDSANYKIVTAGDQYAVVLQTPLMIRALKQMSEVLFVDASGCCDVKDHKIYFFLTLASVGCLPIACVICSSSKLDVFNEGVKSLLNFLHLRPTIVLTDEDILEQNVLQRYFPYSKMLLSSYHVLRSCWRFLHWTKHEIPKSQKQHYYQLFRDLVYADNEASLSHAKQALSVGCQDQPKFIQYVEKMVANIDTWCLLYRQYFMLQDSHSLNYNEAEAMFRTFRLIKDVVLERTKLFNVTQLADFMCSSFEAYYSNRLLEIVTNKRSRIIDERYMSNQSTDLDCEDIGNHQYVFKSTKTVPEQYYKVDMVTNICTCPIGSTGKHCEHQSVVISKFNILSPMLTLEQKCAYYYVAVGVVKNKNLFLPVPETDNADDYTICSPDYDNFSEELDIKRDLESTKNKWISYCNQIIQHMQKDPEKFVPAVNTHLNNVKRYATSVPLLLKGLYAGFPYKGDTIDLPPLVGIRNRTAKPDNH
ncbi:uncharacterized protein LOC132696883 [Cylas formicarius]|uniref:uncharacterized protein LOC132696883 n=1 Tax=Cylas formicarius TaxID=197179 RepID=UPI0029589FFD|nr:uncharacterized protein LOC132696883 [Cylas formicarius]